MEKIPSLKTLSSTVTITVLNKQGHKLDSFQMRGGANLWVFLRKKGFPIGSACSGVGVCGACDLKIIDEQANSVSLQNQFEKETLIKNKKPVSHRLACLCRVYCDLTIQADYW